MSPGMRKAVAWLVIILVISYLLNLNVAVILQNIIHAAQQVHNSNAH